MSTRVVSPPTRAGSSSVARRSKPARPPVRVVPRQPRRAPRAPFVAVVIGLLIAGLGSLLLLNTLLAQGSFTVHDLDQQVALLTDREQALQQQVARLAAPDRLAHKAAGMGMVPAINPAFVRAGSGRILGVPTVGVARVTPAPVTPAPVTPAPVTPAPVTPAPVTPTTDPPVAATSNQQSGSTAKKPDKKRGQKPGKSTAAGEAGGQ